MRGRVIVVAGLAVRTYAGEPVERLRQVGYDGERRARLSWPGVPVGIAGYGRALAAEIRAGVDLWGQKLPNWTKAGPVRILR